MSKLEELLEQLDDAIEDEINRRLIEAFEDLIVYISPGENGRLTITVASNVIEDYKNDEGIDDILHKDKDLAELISHMKTVLGERDYKSSRKQLEAIAKL